jgi:putative intracellular protease/amidase
MHAQIVLFDGFDPLDVIAPYEVLYAGGTASGGASKVTGQRRAILAATEHRP